MSKIDLKKYVAKIDLSKFKEDIDKLDSEQLEQIKNSDCISLNYEKSDSDNDGKTIDLGTYSVELKL